MKAAIQNLVLYLLCMASVVLAAPNQSTLLPRPLDNSKGIAIANEAYLSKPSCIRQAKQGNTSDPSILDGSTRFALW